MNSDEKLGAALAALPPICGAALGETTLERCSLPPEHTGVHGRRRDMQRGNWVGAPVFYELNEACRSIADVFGHHLYLVGPCIKRRDFRDVDVRCMLPDEHFDRIFGSVQNPSHNPYLSLLTIAISAWLKARTGLPVDFQFQRQTEANKEYVRAEGHDRQALGIFLGSPLYPRSDVSCQHCDGTGRDPTPGGM